MAFTRSSVRSRPAPPVLCPHRLVGLGHRPFTAATGVRIPLGTPFFGETCLPSCEAVLMPAAQFRHLSDSQTF